VAPATANILAGRLRTGSVDDEDVRKVQVRREFPTRATQWLQVQIQDRLLSRVLRDRERIPLPLLLKLLQRYPILRRIPAWLVGIGFRPEHVQTPDRAGATRDRLMS